MRKETITYTDYDGNERTEDFYFNLSKPELMEMDYSAAGGMDKMIKKIVDTQDIKKIVELFKDIVLRSYGEKSDDGKRFIKYRDGHRLSDDFAQTEAYNELFMKLATDEGAATDFIKGIIPASLAHEIDSRG